MYEGKHALFKDEEGTRSQPWTKRQPSKTRLSGYPATYTFTFFSLLSVYLALCRQAHPTSRRNKYCAYRIVCATLVSWNGIFGTGRPLKRQGLTYISALLPASGPPWSPIWMNPNVGWDAPMRLVYRRVIPHVHQSIFVGRKQRKWTHGYKLWRTPIAKMSPM